MRINKNIIIVPMITAMVLSNVAGVAAGTKGEQTAEIEKQESFVVEYGTRIFNNVTSPTSYDGYELEWEYSDKVFYDLLSCVTLEDMTVRYTYDGEGNRITKNINGDTVKYEYDNYGYLIRQYSEQYAIDYIFDENNNYYGFYMDNKLYQFIYDDNNIIVGIADGEGKIEAKYNYSNGRTTQITDNDGNLIKDNENAAVRNKIRYKQAYYDDETGWFYIGRYFDSVNGVYVNGLSYEELIPYIEEYGYNSEILYHLNTFLADENKADSVNETDDIKSRAITVGKTPAEKIEVIARTIYGESHYDVKDVACVVSVIRNRMREWKKTAYAVVTDKNQFSAYGGKEYDNMDYSRYTPINSFITECASRLNSNMPLPAGPHYLSEELYFCSVNSAINTITYDDKKKYFVKHWDKSDKIVYRLYFVPAGGYMYNLGLIKANQGTFSGKYNVFYK